MRDSIRKSTQELQLFGKTASEKLEFKLADKGLDASKFQPYLAELRKVEAAHQAASGTLDKMGISAAQTAAALRGVPAQFTDIVTSLQGGQAPLTVFLQQGGQLRDMFGGAGAAARALGGYVLGLINPFTIAAAAVGAIALAYNQGSKEQDAFVKSIVTTGNASGVTAGQLGQYARAISSVAGTQSKAAETLAAFVAEGVRGGAMLEKYAQTAIEWEKATGQSVANTAEQFASLQKDPLSSVLKLNEGTNFLTDSVYKQIKALDEQGRSADASKVAMDALNTAMESRSKTIEQNLGYIEGAWRGITSAAKKAWDAMLNVGRAETGASQLASLRETLDQRMQRGPINDMPSIRAAWEKGNEGLRKQIDLLAEQERMLRRGAEAESERNKQLAARIEFDKAGEQYLSKRARMEREIAKATNEAAAAGVGQAELEQRIASIREKFAEKNTAGMKAQRAAAKLLAEDMAALAKMAGLSPDFYKEWEKYNDMFKRGKLDVDGLTKAQAELLKKQPVIAAETKAQADAQKQVNASIDAYRSALQAVAKEEAARVDGIAKSNADLREQIATMGLTNQQIRQRTIELNRATIAEKEQQLARLQTGYTNTREQAALEEEIRLLKERNGLLSDQGVKEQYVAAQQEITDTWVSIDRTAHDTFVNIFEDGAGTFKRLGQTLKAALLDMLYQMTVKRWIINIGASMGATGGIFAAGSAMAGQGGSGGVGNLAGSALNMAGGSIFGAGGLSGALMGGAGWLTGSTTFGGALGAAGSLIGTGTAGGLASGLAMGAGALAPIALGVGLLGSALGLFRSLERKGGGLVGTLGQAGGVHDVDLMRKGGTLFSGPDWFTEDLGVSKLDKIIQTQFDASKAAIKGFAETLGLSTEKIDGFTTALGTQTMGDHGQLGIRFDKDGKPLSDQEVQAAIAEAIKAGSNELAQLLIGTWTETTRTVQRQVVENMGATLSDYGGGGGYASRTVTEQVTDRTYKPSEFAREGEQAIDTLTRLATSLGTVNGIFDTLGLTLYETSMKGGDLASQLADAAGGLDKLQAASANYYQNFYSAAEQHDIALRQLGKQFEALGVVMPATRDEFRHLVESLDLITEGGRTTFAALMNLSGSFAAVVPAVEEISSSTSEMGRAMGDAARATEDLAAMARKAEDEARRASERAAQDAAQAIVKAAQDAASAASEAARKASEAHSKASAMTDRVFAELRKQFDKALQAARTMVDTAQAIAQMTGERSRALYGEIPESRQYGAAAGNAFIDDALRTMLQGGAMPKTDELSRAIDSAVAGLDVNNYASVAQFQADKAILAAKLGAMEKVAGKQLTEGEQQVELLQQQLEHWDEQLSVLRDTQVSVTSIDDGVRQLSGLMAAESAAAGAAREAQDRYAQASLALQQAQQAQQGAAQQPGSIAGAYNSAVADIRAASWYGNGDWGEARGLKLSELSTAIGVDAGDLARLLVQQGLSLHGDLITTRDAYGDHDAEAAAIRAAKWYGSGNWDDARGSSLIGLAKSMGVDPVDLERRLIAEGMQVSADGIVLSKRYAQGGLHSGGWRLVGEQGPEVEFTGPARYWSFDQSRSMLSGGGGGNEELIAENRALRAKVDQLIARLDRVAAATETSARLMDRVTANGNAMRTEAA